MLKIIRPLIFQVKFENFQGVRVQVRSVYIEGRSQPSKGQYFFAYRIRITNNSDRPVQLLRRHWIITDANGKTENVWWVMSSYYYNYFCIFECWSLKFFFSFFGSGIQMPEWFSCFFIAGELELLANSRLYFPIMGLNIHLHAR